MPVELKDIIEKYGLTIELKEETTVDDFDKALGEKFKEKSIFDQEVKQAVGKNLGTATTRLRQIIGEEGKDKGFDDLVNMLPTVVANRIKAKEDEIEALKAKGSLTGKEQEQLDKLQGELNQTKELLQKANEAKDAALTEKEKALLAGKNELEEYKLNLELTTIYQNSNWLDDTNDYTKIGLYKDKIEGKYVIKKVDDKRLVYKADGETIETDGGTAQLTYEKLIEKVLKEANLWKQNGAKGSKEEAEKKQDLTKITSPFIKSNKAKAVAKAAELEKLEKK